MLCVQNQTSTNLWRLLSGAPDSLPPILYLPSCSCFSSHGFGICCCHCPTPSLVLSLDSRLVYSLTPFRVLLESFLFSVFKVAPPPCCLLLFHLLWLIFSIIFTECLHCMRPSNLLNILLSYLYYFILSLKAVSSILSRILICFGPDPHISTIPRHRARIQ